MAASTDDKKQAFHPLVPCAHCSASVRADRMTRHLRVVHGKSPEPPIGRQVMTGLEQGVRWRANRTETCSSCRRRVVFLDMGRNTLKAFDVDRDTNAILGTHACEDRSESVYAYSGGVIDSNRRRH